MAIVGNQLENAESTPGSAPGTLEARLRERTRALEQSIGECRELKRALRASEARVKDLVEVSSDWYWEMDAALRMTFVSDRIGEITGFDPAAAIGKTRWEMAGVDPETDPVWRTHKADLEARRPFRHFRYSSTAPDGRTYHFRLSGKAVFDDDGRFLGYRGTGTDETAEVEARARAADAEGLMHGITENLPGVVFRCERDTEGGLRYPYISSGTRELLGYERDTLMAHPAALFRAVHGDDAARVNAAVQVSADRLTPLDIAYRVVGCGGHSKWVHELAHPRRFANGTVVWDGLLLDISEQKKVEDQLRLLSTAVHAAANGVVIVNCEGAIVWVNEAFSHMTGYAREEVLGENPRVLASGQQPESFYKALWETVLGGRVWSGEIINRRKDGSLYTEDMTITPVNDGDGEITHFIAVKQDITERKQLEAQLLQANKLESIGQLAAGIAHEINTPTQYVGDNTRFLQEAFEDLFSVQGAFERMLAEAKAGAVSAALVETIDKAVRDADVEYLGEEVPKAIDQALEGVGRISRIVGAMKEFSHPGGEDKEPVDLNRVIETTLTVARNEWKYVADVNTDFEAGLPPVLGYRAELSQVILNLVVNAAHAIGAQRGASGGKGSIQVTTRSRDGVAEVRISDDGPGVPAAIRERVFDPFFTTKEVGKGTGQGLAIARSVVVDKHGGALDLEGGEGPGATFIIELPLDGGGAKP